jgi:hypothetical protein
MKGCWILSKAFSDSTEVIMCWFFFVLLLLICYITFNDLPMLSHPKTTSSWSVIFLIWCWVQFASILLRIFASKFIKRLAYDIFFFIVSLTNLGMIIILTSYNDFSSASSFSISWKIMRSIGISSSSKV